LLTFWDLQDLHHLLLSLFDNWHRRCSFVEMISFRLKATKEDQDVEAVLTMAMILFDMVIIINDSIAY
jgi:hypothetical protein